jgi:hypothetical protein
MLNLLRAKCTELHGLKTARYKQACHTAHKLGCRLRVPLTEWLQQKTLVEDVELPSLCLSGMPIVGDALLSPFFLAFPRTSSTGLPALFKGAPQRRKELIRQFEQHSQRADSLILEEVFRKTAKEVGEGTMRPAMTMCEVTQKYGPDWNRGPTFGRLQGRDVEGNPKVRQIDVHSACGNNAAACRKQKIRMASVNHIANMARLPDCSQNGCAEP